MKSSNLILVILNLFCFHTLLLAGDFKVEDPLRWGSEAATIENASLEIRPKGAFIEYGLILDLSAKGTSFESSAAQLELIMNFSLPEGSFITDSWLWVGTDIMRALLLDRVEAQRIYNGIVVRRRDPSILTKLSPTDYQLRVYPLIGGKDVRKVKINYLVPADWSDGAVSAELPVSILRLSRSIPNMEVLVFSDGVYGAPGLSAPGSPVFSQLSTHEYRISVNGSSLTSLGYNRIEFDNPMKNGLYVQQYFTSSNTGYYQAIISPKEMLGLPDNPAKVAVVFDYDPANSISNMQLQLARLGSSLKNDYTETDSFNLFISYQGQSAIHQANQFWMPMDDLSIDREFFRAMLSGSSTKHSPHTVLGAAADFIKSQGSGGEIVFFSNSSPYENHNGYYSSTYTYKDAVHELSLVHKRVNRLSIRIHAVSYRERYLGWNRFYRNGRYYNGNNYFLESLASDFSGQFIHESDDYDRREHTVYNNTYTYLYLDTLEIGRLVNQLDLKKGPEISPFSLDAQVDDGFVFEQYNQLPSSGMISSHVYTEIGQFYGSSPPEFALDGILNQQAISYKNSYGSNPTTDSVIRQMWMAAHIADAESDYSWHRYNQQQIADSSMAARVLSYYTAFLALEPNDTVHACTDCETGAGGEGDGRPGEGGPMTDIPEIETAGIGLRFFPNPFSTTMTIELELEADTYKEVSLRITDLSGRLIRLFEIDGSGAGGAYRIEWDGTNAEGGEVAAGVYLAVLQIDGERSTSRIVKQ